MVEKATGVSISAANPLTAKIDFSKVEDGGGSGIRPKHLPEGEYVAIIKNVIANKSKAGNPQWVFTISPEEHPGATYPYYCTLSAEQAWKIKLILSGVGVSVPKSVKQINASKLIGKKLGIILEDDEYNGKMKSIIDTIIPVADVVSPDMPEADDDEEDDDDDMEEQAPAPKTRRKKPEPAADDDDDDDDLDLDDL